MKIHYFRYLESTSFMFIFIFMLLIIVIILLFNKNYTLFSSMQTIIMHETLWTEYLVSSIKKTLQSNEIIFVPELQNIPLNGKYPNINKDAIILRGDDKYYKMLSYNSPVIIDTKFGYAKILIESVNKPLTILLISRTSVLNYQKLSNKQKSKLSKIKFVSLWHSQLKNPDSEGVSKSCESIIYNIYGTNNINLNILLLGYGKIGESVASSLKNINHNVYVYEIDKLKKLLAFKRGYIVGELNDLSPNIDFIIDTTGSHNVINEKDLDYFTKKEIHYISFSTNSDAFNFNSNYVNKNDSKFIPTSNINRGLENFYHVGGNDFGSMQITGLTIIYFLKNYLNMLSDFKKIDNYSLYTFSKKQENQIAANIMPSDQTSL